MHFLNAAMTSFRGNVICSAMNFVYCPPTSKLLFETTRNKCVNTKHTNAFS